MREPPSITPNHTVRRDREAVGLISIIVVSMNAAFVFGIALSEQLLLALEKRPPRETRLGMSVVTGISNRLALFMTPTPR